MFAHLRLFAIATLLVLSAAPLMAGDTWDAIEDAQKTAAKTDKPVFLLTILAGPYQPDSGYAKLRERVAEDEDAKGFVLGTVNIYKFDLKSAQAGGSPYGQDAELVKKWGTSTTVSVLAPGANKPLWRLAGGGYKEDIFKQAREAYDAWRKDIDDIEAKMKEDKDLKKDPETLLKLAEAWASGYAAEPALKSLDAAMKAIKKADKESAELEKLALRRADILLACDEFADAAKEYATFVKRHKDSELSGKARIGLAKGLAGAGDKDGAIKALKELAEDDAAAELKPEAEALLKELQKE